MSRLLAVDGNWYLHRIFHTSSGYDVVPRFISLISKDALTVKATNLLVALDGDQIFRFKLYPHYKSSRVKEVAPVGNTYEPTKEVYDQIDEVRATLTSLGIPWVQHRKYEADDILCSASHQLCNQYDRIYLGTSDKDSFQSLKQNVMLYRSIMDNPVFNLKDLMTKHGVTPAQWIQVQTLVGDPGDDVPGLEGIKYKTALKMMVNADWDWPTLFKQAKPELRSKLIAHKSQLRINKQLVTLVTDCKLPRNLKVPKSEDKSNSTFNKYQSFLYPRSRGLFG